MMPGTTPSELLRSALARDGGRPFVTYYDDGTGERIELSVTTFDNWVAKSAGLLRDGLEVEPGDRVGLLLPAHWQSLVLASACWAVGACAVLDAADDIEVAVVAPESLYAAPGARETLALSLRPLGARFAAPLPAGVLDYAVEVPSYPDRFVPYEPPDPFDPALERRGVVTTYDGLLGQAETRTAQLDAHAGARLLVATDDLRTALRDALLLPLVLGGSAVLVRNEIRAGRETRLTSERAQTAHP
jgi:uncharacterized protein (TIGR03089 family)